MGKHPISSDSRHFAIITCIGDLIMLIPDTCQFIAWLSHNDNNDNDYNDTNNDYINGDINSLRFEWRIYAPVN